VEFVTFPHILGEMTFAIPVAAVFWMNVTSMPALVTLSALVRFQKRSETQKDAWGPPGFVWVAR
jgi:hypothetical protein